MKKNEMMKKYEKVIANVCAENAAMDKLVGFDMLKSTVFAHFGMTYTAAGSKKPYDVYKGVPADFDYAAFLSDYVQLVAAH